MEEFLKTLAEAIKDKDSKVEIHKMDAEEFKKMLDDAVIHQVEDDNDDYVSDAVEIAHMNKVMYDAHIGQGFSPDEALALTIAVINN